MIEPECKYLFLFDVPEFHRVSVNVADPLVFRAMHWLPYITGITLYPDGARHQAIVQFNRVYGSLERCKAELGRFIEAFDPTTYVDRVLVIWDKPCFNVEPGVPIEVVQFLLDNGAIDGGHHKQWVIDQALRRLLGDDYEKVVKAYNANDDYDEWDEGIAP